MQKILKFFTISLLLLVMLKPAFTKDYVSKILGNTVATFSDALELLYNSFNPVELVKNKKRKTNYKEKAKKQKEIDIKRMQDFLKKHGINAPSLSLSQPLTKQDFAKLLFKRFKTLPHSFLSSQLQFNYLYFKDAQELGIFSTNETAEDTLTTKDLLKSFLRATKLSPK